MAHKPERDRTKWMIAATAAALAAILWGALFLIAPIWQWPVRAAVYLPPQTESQAQDGTAYGNTELVNVNTADADALTALLGIGTVKAEAIVAYREEHGPFATLQDLDNVDGISDRMVESWLGLATTGTTDSDTN